MRKTLTLLPSGEADWRCVTARARAQGAGRQTLDLYMSMPAPRATGPVRLAPAEQREELQRTKGSERKTKVESRDGWCTLRVAGLNWEGHESRALRSVNRLGSRAPQHLAVVQPKTDVRERACALLLKLPNWNAEGASSCASLASEIRIQVRVG
jgi:hypothetical protein